MSPTSPSPYRYWAIVEEDDGTHTAKCRCGWQTNWPTYTSARTATMYHYYVCPKRWEIFNDDSI